MTKRTAEEVFALLFCRTRGYAYTQTYIHNLHMYIHGDDTKTIIYKHTQINAKTTMCNQINPKPFAAS